MLPRRQDFFDFDIGSVKKFRRPRKRTVVCALFLLLLIGLIITFLVEINFYIREYTNEAEGLTDILTGKSLAAQQKVLNSLKKAVSTVNSINVSKSTGGKVTSGGIGG